MSQNRKTWAAVSYPEMPARLSPEATAKRAYVRIGVRVAKITLPVMLAAGFAAIAGNSGSSSGGQPTPVYPGDKLALSVRLQMTSHGLLPKGMSVECDDAAMAVGALASCYEYTQSLDDTTSLSFHVRFDGDGKFSFSTPDGVAEKGSLVG